MFSNSLDKVVKVYIAGITRQAFYYERTLILPKPLHVSPLIFPGFTCPVKCGACCPRFSLEYLPTEVQPAGVVPYQVEVNGAKRLLFHDAQTDHSSHYCRNLDQESGRCQIHGRQPFSCDFELLRFLQFQDYTVLTQKLFGRKWAMLRVDGERGAKCEMIPLDASWHEDIMRRLTRLREWATYLGVAHTYLPDVIEWVRTGPHEDMLLLNP